jgi:hypothetical protein
MLNDGCFAFFSCRDLNSKLLTSCESRVLDEDDALRDLLPSARGKARVAFACAAIGGCVIPAGAVLV